MNNTKITCKSGATDCEVYYEVLLRGPNFLIEFNVEPRNCSHVIICRDASGMNVIKPTTQKNNLMLINCKQGNYIVGISMKNAISENSYVFVKSFNVLPSNNSSILKCVLKQGNNAVMESAKIKTIIDLEIKPHKKSQIIPKSK